jgi:hypothetical protein
VLMSIRAVAIRGATTLAVGLVAIQGGSVIAQSSRQQAGILLSVTAPVWNLEPRADPVCPGANGGTTLARSDSARTPVALTPTDLEDDVIDPQVLAPGSGMVVVDSHGREIREPGYTARTGSVALDRCADAMKPPPSSRSPL